jgi:hypothetical protein
LIFTSGIASGVNSYAAVLVLGLLGRFGHIAAIPPVLERPPVLAAAAVLYIGQFVVGKIPVLDSVWDVVHTLLRPVVGGAIGAVMAQQAHAAPAATLAAAALGGGSALASHVVKTGTRIGINASPEPFSNIGASLLEDLGVAGLVSFAVFHPVAAAGVAAVVLAAGIALFALLASRIRHAWQRRRSRRQLAGPTPVVEALAGGADADDAGEVELCLVLAAGDSGVDDDLQVGVAVAEDVAIDGDIANIGMTDGLAVLGVPGNGAIAPQLREAGAAIQHASDQPGHALVARVTGRRAAQVSDHCAVGGLAVLGHHRPAGEPAGVASDPEARLHQVAVFGRHAGRVAEQCRPAAVPPDQLPVGREHRDRCITQASQHPLHARRDVVGDGAVLRRLQAGQPVQVIALLAG